MSSNEEDSVGSSSHPHVAKKNNSLPTWGNERNMNINEMIFTNIQSSPYFKVELFKLKTFHEVVDEIYYKVRGVGAGGVVSTVFCLLYKLFTLKLTRKQLCGLLNHSDSPYIRAIGFLYIRYCQPPQDLWGWFEPYLDDEEELEPKAGGGHPMTIGSLALNLLTKLDWYGTLLPRIPVPVQKGIEKALMERNRRKAVEEIAAKNAPSLDLAPQGNQDGSCSSSPEPRGRDRRGHDIPRRPVDSHHNRHRSSRKEDSSRHRHSSKDHRGHGDHRSHRRDRSRSPLEGRRRSGRSASPPRTDTSRRHS